MCLYLVHFPFILLFDFYLIKGTLLDFLVTLLFCMLVFILEKIFIPKKYKFVFGG